MKISSFFISLFLLSLSPSLMAFDLLRYENESCPKTIVDRGNGYYSVRPVLTYQNEGEDSVVLQKVNGPEGPYYQVYDSFGTFYLRAKLGRVSDFVVYRSDLWVLADGELKQFDNEGKFLNSFRYRHFERSERPVGMALRDGNIIIAHGKMGLINFDVKKQVFTFMNDVNTWQDDGKRSKAVAVSWQGSLAFVALSGLQEGAFNGIVTYDISKNEVVNTSKYRNGREGVIDPRAKIYSFGDTVYLNNGGWIHRLKVSDLLKRSLARPAWLGIPHRHGDLNRYLMIRGDLVFSNDEILGCGLSERTPVFARRKL